MADRWFQRGFFFSRMVVVHNVKVPLSSTGVVGTVVGEGVTSVVKTSTGLYTFTFVDKFNDLLGFFASLVCPGTETLPLIAIPKINYSLTSKTAAVVFQPPNSNTATDVTVASELHVVMYWKNTNVTH